MESASNEFNLGALLPSMDSFMGFLELAARIAVMAGPLLLLGFGLIFLLSPPKEANFGLGFRTRRSMSSLEAWTFAQRLAGMVWSALGAVLTIVMALVCSGFRDLNAIDMAWRAVICLIIELVLAGGACIGINAMLMRRFDKDGFPLEETEE